MKQIKSKLYDENSIESLSPRDFTRLKPGVYAGDTTYSTQLLIEILSNAVDEHRMGHGDKIETYIEENEIDGYTITVRDYGQGFLVDSMREDGKSVFEAAFSVLNTSGKYRENGTYEGISLGSFGIGSKITNFLSNYLEAQTFRDGREEYLYFEEGILKERSTSRVENMPSGTRVTWKPSKEFFSHVEVDIEVIKKLYKTISCLCKGLKLILNYKGKEYIYYSENGISDLIEEKEEILKNRLNISTQEGKYKLDLVMTYTPNYSSTIIPFVNTGLTESGVHITQLKTTLTREMNKFFKEKKWLKEKDENLSGEDIQEGLYLVFNMTAPNVSYDAQVKSRVTKIDTKPFIQMFTEELQKWLNKNEKEIKKIADKALKSRKAREAAKKAREAIRDDQKKREKKILKVDSKLADCYSKNREKCEIYLTEGDSASGNLKLARDNEFQAVMPLRGKILNLFKASIDKILKNEEIKSMIVAFGLKGNIETMKFTYKKEELRYGKIIIAVDADPDGSHIAILLLTFLWNVCPELILNGYVYILVPPLYKMTINKTYIYIKNDKELAIYKEKYINKKYQLSRFKGLGEMNADETEETLVDPEKRILKQVLVKDAQEVDNLFKQLMGTAVAPRREFIQKYGKEAKYL